MLVLDAFRCHRMPAIKAMLQEDRTDLVIIPGGMTGQLQVMDVSCNRPFKQHMRQRWNEWMTAGDHTFTPSGNARKPDLGLIATWIKESWDAVDPDIIRRGFKKCCLSNSMDGEEDDIIWEDMIAKTNQRKEDKDDCEDDSEGETHDEDEILNDGMYGEEEEEKLRRLFDSDVDSGSDFEGFNEEDV